jgi:23S rRNA pseudouridine1911/1915/1917 synthase
MPLPLAILFEDNHCLAVAKPAGMLTQVAPAGFESLESCVKDYLRRKYDKKGRIYLGIPHRLDRPVSGVVLFARQTKSAQRLAEQFRVRQVQKTYWAAVEGDVEPAEGTWVDWLLKVTEEARSIQASAETPGAKEAVLRYRRLAKLPVGTLLEFQPETGRMHQLRVQAAWRGWPIIGDRLYGSQTDFGPPAELVRDRPIGLHGRVLTFLHPVRYEPITVIAPLPELWRTLGLPPDIYPWGPNLPCADDSP